MPHFPIVFGNDVFYDVSYYCSAFKFANFVEHNISYEPCKFQLSRMSGSNLTERGGKHPPSAAPGGKSPVLLGLMVRTS